MENSLEIVGEGNKMIVVKKKEEGYKHIVYNYYSKILTNKRFNMINYEYKLLSTNILYSYIDIFKYIHYFSDIFIKNVVIKILKDNDINYLNVMLQYYWVKKLTYNNKQIFDDHYLVDNNFVVFNSQFTDFIKDILDHYNFKRILIYIKNQVKLIIKNQKKVNLDIVENVGKFVKRLQTKMKQLLELIYNYIEIFKKSDIYKNQISDIIRNIQIYLMSLTKYYIVKCILTHYNNYINMLKKIKEEYEENQEKEKKKRITTNQYMFKEIYNFHNFVWYNNLKRYSIGYVEENLFFIPPYLELLSSISNQTTNDENSGKIEQNKDDSISATAQTKNEKEYLPISQECNQGNKEKNQDNKYLNFHDNYISVELKLKCGILDYNDMIDKYNIHQIIKLNNNKNIQQLSLYEPSEFFNLNFKDIFTNLNYIFLSKNNNMNIYINNKKEESTVLSKFIYYSNYLNRNNDKRHSSINEKNNAFWEMKKKKKKKSIQFYFNYLRGKQERKKSLTPFNLENFKHPVFSSYSSIACYIGKKKEKNNNVNNYTISSNINKANVVTCSGETDSFEKIYVGEDNYTNVFHETVLYLVNKIQMKMSWGMPKNKQNIIDYSQRHLFVPKHVKYAYKNYIFSNNFYLKYVMNKSADCKLRKMLCSLKKKNYRSSVDELLDICELYKDIYYLNFLSLYKKTCYLFETRYRLILGNYLDDKLHSNGWKKNKVKGKTIWNQELAQYEFKEYSNHKKIRKKNIKLSYRKIKSEVLQFFMQNKELLNDSDLLSNLVSNTKYNIKILNDMLLNVKKSCEHFFHVYKNELIKLKNNKFPIWKQKFDIKKEELHKMYEEKIKKYILYIYDTQIKTNYYYNTLITNEMNLAIKGYFEELQYNLKKILNTIKESIIDEKVHISKFRNIFNGLLYALKNAYICDIGSCRYLFSGSIFGWNNNNNYVGSVNMIKQVLNNNNALDAYKKVTEINKNTLNLLILTNVISHEKNIFYKILYFHSFSAGQIQLVYFMMDFIDIFGKLFNLKKKKHIFSNFMYYKSSLKDMFMPKENHYFNVNKHLRHLVDIRKIKRIENYVFNEENVGNKLKYKHQNTNTKKTNTQYRYKIKYKNFIYLQNAHFMLGNELLIEALDIINKLCKHKFDYLESDMKINTRKLYYGLYKSAKKFAKRYTCNYKSIFKRDHKKSKKYIVNKFLSKETFITNEHFEYLTNALQIYRKKVGLINLDKYINRRRIVYTHDNIYKKALLIFKSMIYFVCRYLISKTFCDNSTIFNIYIPTCNKTNNVEIVKFLENNRFKSLILSQHSNKKDGQYLRNEQKINEEDSSKIVLPEEKDKGKKNNHAQKDHKKKRIRKNKLSSYQYPFIILNLSRKKRDFMKKEYKQFKKHMINAYIPWDYKEIFYRISLIDLSMKSINKMGYWKKQMESILSVYREYCQCTFD
ncbi:conserved Plasmodium protein, unknown function [Plasmodium berghei]|uniref:Uncharacterized protein n=2 Tax=Plasmodium berghei TaxID=5821 RepID=A0A509ANA5_PLABA|nr:conserved Plasmodium protein, unknown function [Plasmodium berghei ANKA]CXI29611.1 conserved Plasmodium protein, unknown function [Plasmodium berghei]SCM20739.1 conserved Plasmodium protein, unknown function [Plasmodium berghei]SCN24291.1 conserved Plasmodium protein, unknown function [Plasmodium berghei]SCO59477.1 conserved Plasmodium protein, unknown function [Plasmodium berghei]SCO60715.1 conserved Plasmodium protein, unknown function [Plasmodium berghei]|eukprot:XP_034421017.1 conserved Plasmodium protein, unknown function [Plasmodium berghei ANKA]